LSETANVEPATEVNEFGVPSGSATAKYAWLGSDGDQTELPSGIINMGARVYVPGLGRFEQTDPCPGGSVNAYAYTFDDPASEADPSGEWTVTGTPEPGAPAPGTPTSGLEPGAVVPHQRICRLRRRLPLLK
jgi:RHS repeat-associated protein